MAHKKHLLLIPAVLAALATVGVLFIDVSSLQGAASVIQAIWSIFAVWFAFLYSQIDADERSRAEVRRKAVLLSELCSSAAALMKGAKQGAENALTALQYRADYNLAEWKATAASLDAFPIDALDSAQQIRDLLTLRTEVAGCINELQTAEKADFGASTLTLPGAVWRGALENIGDALDRVSQPLWRIAKSAQR